MCILLSTTEHPDYPFILLSNRDEFFRRPTAAASFRNLPKSTAKLLSPLDLARPEHGTWIGVTTEGKLAVLLNYRENDMSNLFSEISRGVIPLEYLEYSGDSLSVDEWVNSLEESILNHQGQGKELINGDKKESPLGKVGGFTLLYGKLELNDTCTSINNLNILSNRGDRGKVHVPLSESTIELDDSVEHQTTFGLSNSLYFDPWPKVKLGQELLRKCIKTSIVKKQNLPELLNSCFDVLSNDTFDKSIADNPDLSFTTKSLELRNSIFIPPIELGFGIPAVGDGPIGQMGPGGATIGKYYGTRTQTVILLDKSGELHYFEKNLHNSDDLDDGCNEVKHFHFNIK